MTCSECQGRGTIDLGGEYLGGEPGPVETVACVRCSLVPANLYCIRCGYLHALCAASGCGVIDLFLPGDG